VVKRKTHAEHNTSLETPARVCLEPLGILVATTMEKERRDCLDWPFVEQPAPIEPRLDYMNHTHNNGRSSRPLHTPTCRIDSTAMCTNPAKPRCARIPLCDRICRDQSESAAAPQQIKCLSEEISHEIGIAVALVVAEFEPIGIRGEVCTRNRVLSGEGRIPNNRIKAAFGPLEYFGELDSPVKGSKRFGVTATLGQPLAILLRLVLINSARVFI